MSFFESLEPKKSKVELDLLEKVYKNNTNSDLDLHESKLKFSLYLNGDECSDEDKELYQRLRNEEIDKEKYPNLFKWKKLMETKK